MLFGDAAVIESGIPLEHGRVFSQVASNLDTIIISRSVGKYATNLIREGHASKGFHVKTKSCDWGPMAGFVLADPRFSKKGTNRSAIASQSKATEKACSGGSELTKVYISNARKQELTNELNCMSEVQALSSSASAIVYKANATNNPIFKFVLVQDDQCPMGPDGRKWRVCYHESEQPQGPKQAPRELSVKERVRQISTIYKPVFALTNPGANSSDHKQALTGDYDLWGCFPAQQDFSADSTDRRDVKNSNSRLYRFADYNAEDENLGNMSTRLRLVKICLNSGFSRSSGGNMVHHSDEAGRPMVDNIELDAVAFLPWGNHKLFLSTVKDYKLFISLCRYAGYKTILNAWWKLYMQIPGVNNQTGEAIPGYNKQTKEFIPDAQMSHILAMRNKHLDVLADIRDRHK